LGTFLLCEILRSLASLGVSVVDAQTTQEDVATLGMLRKLDFQEVSTGTVFRKEAGA
jgi:hypothetical protein